MGLGWTILSVILLLAAGLWSVGAVPQDLQVNMPKFSLHSVIPAKYDIIQQARNGVQGGSRLSKRDTEASACLPGNNACTTSSDCVVGDCIAGVCRERTFTAKIGDRCNTAGWGHPGCADGGDCVDGICVDRSDELDNFGCSCSVSNSECVCINGVCDNFRLAGDPCENDVECMGGGCRNGLCTGEPDNELCYINSDHPYFWDSCAKGSYCHVTSLNATVGVCRPQKPEGSACDMLDFFRDGCAGTSFCDLDFSLGTNGTCRKMLQGGLGAACTTHWACQYNLTCVNGQCAVPPAGQCTSRGAGDCPAFAECHCNGSLAACTYRYNMGRCGDGPLAALLACMEAHQCPFGGYDFRVSCQPCLSQYIALYCCEFPGSGYDEFNCTDHTYHPHTSDCPRLLSSPCGYYTNCTSTNDCAIGVCHKGQCAEVLRTARLGKPCNVDLGGVVGCAEGECVDGVCSERPQADVLGCPCAANDSCPCIDGRCDAYLFAGDTCGRSAQCMSGLCYDSLCIGQLPGQACTVHDLHHSPPRVWNPCVRGFYCQLNGSADEPHPTSGVCAPLKRPGDRCSRASGGCPPGYICDFPGEAASQWEEAGVCRKMLAGAVDEPCFSRLACQPSLVCMYGVCRHGASDFFEVTHCSDRGDARHACPMLSHCGCSGHGQECIVDAPSGCDAKMQAFLTCLEQHMCNGFPDVRVSCTQCRQQFLEFQCCQNPYNPPAGFSCSTMKYDPRLLTCAEVTTAVEQTVSVMAVTEGLGSAVGLAVVGPIVLLTIIGVIIAARVKGGQ